MKVCPKCAESVQDAAKVCRYCGHSFSLFASSASSKSSGCGTLALVILVILFVIAVNSGAGDKATTPLLTAAEAAANLEQCGKTLDLGRKTGVLLSIEGNRRMIVNEWRWALLDWETKKGLAIALACHASGGQKLTDQYVAVYSNRSGKMLASGIPGMGAFTSE